MKVRPKYFTYEDLPCIHCKDKLMAASGMYMEPGPKIPGLKNKIIQSGYPERELFPSMPKLDYDPRAIISTSQLPPIDTTKAIPQQQPPQTQQNQGYQGPNFGNAALLGLAAFDALLPNRVPRQTVVQPQMAYNPNPYGQGSQAMMEYGGYLPTGNYGYVMGEDENNSPSAKNGNYMKAKDGHWIQKAVNPAHKGYCTPMTKSTCTPRRKALAKTFKKHHGFHKSENGGKYGLGNWSETDRNDAMSMLTADMDIGGFIAPGWDRYDHGGIIPDNMSNFNPHVYEQGGNVNGGAKLREVGANYPNSDLMEQWLLYEQGGNVNGGAKIREVGPNYPNSDLMEQWLLYANGGNVNGGAKIKDVGAMFPNTDLMEQWLLYEHGGTLSADKAKEMLRDGTANGKKLTSKQKKYFGMVASGKAQMGINIPFTGDPKPKKKATTAAKTPVAPAAQAASTPLYAPGSDVNWTSRRLQGANTDRDAYTADNILGIVGNNYDPYGRGKGYLNALDTDLANQVGVRIKQLQATNPNYGTMTPEQRISAFYQSSGTGNTTLDQFINRTRTLGGSPSAYWQGHPGNPTRGMKNGGVMYEDGGEIGTMWGGTADLESYNPYDGGTVEFNGPSHDQGGIGMHYNGNPIEVEGGEYASKDAEGNLNIYGNMYIPGTKTKFKKGAKAIANKEKRYDFLKTKGSDLVNNSNPASRFDQLKFNAGRVMMDGGQMGMQDLASKKEKLAGLQRSMLDMASELGLDPFEMSKGKAKKAKGGASIPFFQDGGEQDPDPARRKLLEDKLKMQMDGVRARLAKKNGPKWMRERDEHALKDPAWYFKDAINQFKGLVGTEQDIKDYTDILKLLSSKKSSPTTGDPDVNDPTRADRNMNPGNIKYGKFAQKYGAKKDKDGFAIFPDRATGEKAMKELLTSDLYKNLPVDQAIHKWTGKHPYRYDLGPLTGKTVSDLNPDELDIVLSTMKQGEGTRYGVGPRPAPKPGPNTPTPQIPTAPYRPYTIPDVPLGAPQTPYDPIDPVPPYDQLQDVPEVNRPSNVTGLSLNNVLGEIYGAATNKVEPVPAQRYEPQLFTPYQVSFQDRLNANQSVFNAQSRAVGASNPAALGTLGAQKYAADSAVMADEFRTNQAIANDITNKNIALVNDANLKNLGIADTQMVRQSQARSKTREFNQMILNSLSDKYAKNNLENKRLAAYENLYDYRFVPTEDGGLKATYFGPNAMFNYDGKNSSNQTPNDIRTISRYDAQGNLKGYNEYDESDIKVQQRMLDMENKRRKMSMLSIPPLGR